MSEEEEFLVKMKNFFENIGQLERDLENQIKEREFARNDLLHELELGNLNAVETSKVSKTLKEVLKERRTYKDELEKVKALKEFSDKYNNRMITGDIILVLKKLRKIEQDKETRTYTPRRITNLKCGGNK